MMSLNQPCQNQLKFTMDVPVKLATAGVKFRPPQPIIVEKFGTGSHTPLESSCNGALMKQQLRPAFEFSSISEDKLSMAVRLARQDLHRQKQQEEQETVKCKVNRLEKYSAKKKASTPHSLLARSRSKKKDSAIVIKQEGKKKCNRPTTPVQAVVHIATRPVAPCSPPTRDTDPYRAVRESNQDNRVLQEITRLRDDMHKCLLQIQGIEAAAKKGASPIKLRSVPGTEDLLSEEQERRRAIRAEENATRSSRTIYALQKQVKDIQEDLAKVKPEEMATKKSKLLLRLAAAHRAAVRALQAFVNQLPDVNLSVGLPRTYKELTLVVRQLSLCCAQLEVSGDTPVPESVTNLLQDMAAMNMAMERELEGHEGEARQNSGRDDENRRQLYPNQPAAIQVTKPVQQTQGRCHANKENRGVTPDRESALQQGMEALLRAVDGPSSGLHPPCPAQHRPCFPSAVHPDVPRLAITPRTPRGPTRRATPAHVAWDLPFVLPSVSEQKPQRPQTIQHRKGVLFPSSLQNRSAKSRRENRKVKRDRVMRPTAILGPSHYAEPTVSTRMKKVPPHELPQPETYPPQPRTPSPTPRSPRSHRRVVLSDAPTTFADPTISSQLKTVPPNEHLHSDDAPPPFLPPSPSSRRRSNPGSPRRDYLGFGRPRLPGSPPPSARSLLPTRPSDNNYNRARREIARQVQLDREGMKSIKDLEDLKNTEVARYNKLTANLDETDDWVRETEHRIRQKIKPLLEQAQEIMDRYEAVIQAEHSSLRQSLSPKTLAAVECNADVLADMILHDVLDETVCELQKTEDEDIAEEIAWNMQQAPSVTNLVQRLQEMEEEQDDIRRRWATIVYEDEGHNTTASYFDVRGQERPQTPPPIHLTKQGPEQPRELTPTRTRLMRVPHPHEEAESEAIYFTRPQNTNTLDETLHLSSLNQQGSRHPQTQSTDRPPRQGVTVTPARMPLYISRETVESVRGYVSRYEAHLRRLATNPVGDFNPWHVVDEIADAILSDCVEDVAKELEEINSDIINHIYHSEFTHVPDDISAPPPGGAAPPPGGGPAYNAHGSSSASYEYEDSISER